MKTRPPIWQQHQFCASCFITKQHKVIHTFQKKNLLWNDIYCRQIVQIRMLQNLDFVLIDVITTLRILQETGKSFPKTQNMYTHLAKRPFVSLYNLQCNKLLFCCVKYFRMFWPLCFVVWWTHSCLSSTYLLDSFFDLDFGSCSSQFGKAVLQQAAK